MHARVHQKNGIGWSFQPEAPGRCQQRATDRTERQRNQNPLEECCLRRVRNDHNHALSRNRTTSTYYNPLTTQTELQISQNTCQEQQSGVSLSKSVRGATFDQD